jgi:hypothetical protein
LIRDNRKARRSGQEFVQQTELLGPDLLGHIRKAGDVAARPVEAGDETEFDGIAAAAEYNRNGLGRSLGGGSRNPAARRHDHRHSAADQIGRQCRQPRRVI